MKGKSRYLIISVVIFVFFFPALTFARSPLKNPPSPGEFVAFSLKEIKGLIQEAGPKRDYRKIHPEVYCLGGINKIHGLVYDEKKGDLILVGKYDPDRPSLTMDDLAVALRARFIYNKWPLVSIDPTPQTQKSKMQHVRFEGGIEDTRFGADLFDADFRLKRIGMGLLDPGVPNLKTYWAISIEQAKAQAGESFNIGSRFWFYPVLPSVAVRKDVAAIRGLKVAVFTEVLSAKINGKQEKDLSTFHDRAGDEFSKEVSKRFPELSRVHPSFARLQGLDELVALTRAIEEMDKRPDLFWWLKEYRIKKVKTKKNEEVLKREKDYEATVSGGVYTGRLEVSGGVQLTAIALRLRAGDVTALKQAVLKTRPSPESLSWTFVVGKWLIPTAPGMLKMVDIAPLFAQALFLQNQKRYDEAIAVYAKVIGLKPDWPLSYSNRVAVYADQGHYDHAISDFNKALEINPRLAKVYSNRGSAYANQGDYDHAISDFNKALEINPRYPEAYSNRAKVCEEKGKFKSALKDLKTALRYKFADAILGPLLRMNEKNYIFALRLRPRL